MRKIYLLIFIQLSIVVYPKGMRRLFTVRFKGPRALNTEKNIEQFSFSYPCICKKTDKRENFRFSPKFQVLARFYISWKAFILPFLHLTVWGLCWSLLNWSSYSEKTMADKLSYSPRNRNFKKFNQQDCGKKQSRWFHRIFKVAFLPFLAPAWGYNPLIIINIYQT